MFKSLSTKTLKPLLIALLMAATGFLHAQDYDVYTCGYFMNSYGKQSAAVYKNGSLLYSFGNADYNYTSAAVAVDPDTKDVYWTVSYRNADDTDHYCNIYKNDDLYLYNNNFTSIYELCFYEGHLYAVGKRKHSGTYYNEWVVWKDNISNPLFSIYDAQISWIDVIQEVHFCIEVNIATDGAIYLAHTSGEYSYFNGEYGWNYATKVWKYTFTTFQTEELFTVPGSRVKKIAFYNNSVYTACIGYKGDYDEKSYIYKNENLLFEENNDNLTDFCMESGDYYTVYGYPDYTVYKNGEEYFNPTSGQHTPTMLAVNSLGLFTNTNMQPYNIYRGTMPLFSLPEIPKAMVVLTSCEDEYTRPLPYDENFERGETEWECWYKYDIDANNNYRCSFWDRCGTRWEPEPYEGEFCAEHYYNSYNTQNGMLVTPKLFLQPNRGSTQLTFKTLEQNPSKHGYLGVGVSTGYHTPNNFTDIWTQSTYSETWRTQTIDLSDYQGEAIYLGFHYGGLDGCSWFIDNVSITEDNDQCPTQTTLPYTETFDSDMDCWFVIDTDMSGGKKCWQWSESDQCVYHPWGQQGTPQVGWLFSRPISLNETGYNYTLSFKAKTYQNGTGRRNSVWIAVDKPTNHAPWPSDYTEIWVDPSYSNNWTNYEIDLSQYAGHTVNIAFKYEGTYAHNWYIDDFSIEKQALQPEVITIGSGTATSEYLPTWTHYEFSLTQQIYTASEIGDACTIEKIAFYNAGTTKTRIIDLYMKNTSKTSFSAGDDWIICSSVDKVFSGTVTFTSGQWTEITLTTPFAYNGFNLAVIFDDDTDFDSSGAEFRVFDANGSQALRIASAFADFDPIDPSGTGYTMTVKNQIKLTTAPGGGGGPQVVTIGNGSSSNCGKPIDMNYNYSITEQIYDPEEIGTAGTITSIAFNYDYTEAFSTNMKVFMKNVSRSTFSSQADIEPLSASNLVWDGTFAATGPGWVTLTLDTPFPYDGTSHLLVTCFDGTDGYFGYDYNFLQTMMPNYDKKSIFWESDSNIPDPYNLVNSDIFEGGINEYRNNIQLGITPGGGGGNELTVYPNGTDNENRIPMYVYYFDNFSRSQHIIPASELTAMNGGQITAIKYYTDPGNIPYTTESEVDIYLKEVSGTTLSTFVDKSTAQIVYHGTVSFVSAGSNGETTITFTTPFTYNGGNLLVGCDNTTDAGYKNINFIGDYGHMGAAIYGSSTSSLANVSPNPCSFLPKTTFTYTGGGGGNFTQSTDFVNGWTWWSSGVETSADVLSQLKSGLGSHGKVIKSQTQSTMQVGSNWVGSLAMNNESSYMVRADANVTVSVSGSAANPASHTITLDPGWTWVGYPCSESMAINTALANLTPQTNDVMKSQQQTAMYMMGQWRGALATLTPGMGLMYKSNKSTATTLTYATPSKASEPQAEAPETHWKANYSAYPTNMTVLAVVELDGKELDNDHYELAAFADGECRGAVRLMYVEPLDRHFALLTIAGDEASELRFSLYDTETGMVETVCTPSLQYETDAVVGSPDEPFIVRFRSNTGVDEWAGNVNLFPNPVERGQTFSLGLTDEIGAVQVEIINALGVVETQNFASLQGITAPRTAGVYTLRITVEGKGSCYRKLVVR